MQHISLLVIHKSLSVIKRKYATLKNIFTVLVYANIFVARVAFGFSLICQCLKRQFFFAWLTKHFSTLFSLVFVSSTKQLWEYQAKKNAQFVEHWDSKPYEVCNVNFDCFYVQLRIVLYVSIATIKFPNVNITHVLIYIS